MNQPNQPNRLRQLPPQPRPPLTTSDLIDAAYFATITAIVAVSLAGLRVLMF